MPSFYEDVIKNDARFNSAKRVADPELLEPVTRAAIANILQDARALGIELMVFETYRSQARQQELFNQGASKLRVGGVHHYGLACDLVKSSCCRAWLRYVSNTINSIPRARASCKMFAIAARVTRSISSGSATRFALLNLASFLMTSS